MSGAFLFDEFFVPEDDKGHEVVVKIRGRDVPVFVSRGLSLADREAAKAKSVQTKLNTKTGQIELLGVDETAFQVELLLRAIKSWPFTYKDGKPVEINRKNIQAMLSDGVDALLQEVLGLLNTERESLDPFEKQSGEGS